MYKPLLPFIFAAFCIPSLQAQTLKTGALGKAGETSGWIEFHSSLNLNPKTVLADYKAEFGLAAEDELLLSRVENDELGMSHYRFQMYREGVKVETGQYMIHARAGRAETGNGYLPQLPQLSTVPAIGADAARQLALSHMNAQTYMWEQPGSEAALKHSRKDPAATFYPQPELVLTDTDFDRDNGSGWVLAWKTDVYAAQPVSRKWIYIDAATGKVVKELETLHLHHPDQVQANATGSAVTRYSGTQTIITDQTATGYRLREAARGLGVDIETYDLNQSTDFSQAVDFLDDDNVWNNVNTEFDEAATDAHWGAEMTHDFFLQKFGRSSFDGKGSIMKSYVHYDVAYFNAFWNGVWMTFGDGNGAPLTSLDVVGHEFAHGVTGNSAELIYAYEPGALNESFSDIFGNSIEHFADTTIADWRIGEGFGAFRNMASPSAFGDPDTYKGSGWVYGTFDNGGVHINSGVQNKWYYLLVEGGSGTNNKGEAYQVTGIGWNAAAAIAYRNLTTYLLSASQFADAREGAIQAAIDLYGKCSPEYQAVINA
ncbi:MAG: M4 family peptidase, partial [Bacteroidetes bacterium]